MESNDPVMEENKGPEEAQEAPLDIEEIKLTRLDIVCENALHNGKYVILFDKSANCEIYFNYKATMKEFHKEMLAVTMQ